MLSKEQFEQEIFRIAKRQGYNIEKNKRNGLKQIVFDHKKLHADHIQQLYPDILTRTEELPKLIEKVAPGRPCTHRPMREIIYQIKQNCFN
ncbi:MAG: hypothetical protein SRB2_04849 [Desulfobacteraceae bacterium Eth-SRB2]|nr:MAG: hypothetical protein SRB2_04849 [Desulfobacteraceae bacterium Eth-SRB2]